MPGFAGFHHPQRRDEPGIGQDVDRPPLVVVERHPERWPTQKHRDDAVAAADAAQGAAVAVDGHRIRLRLRHAQRWAG